MKEVIALTLPSLIFTPIFFMTNTAMHFGNDLAYPDFYGFYPFPVQICNPICGILPLGVIGSLLYWIIGYFLYFKAMEKHDYSIGKAFRSSIVFGGTAFLFLLISVFYIFLFVPKVPQV